MAAADNVSPEQLKLLMTPSEILAQYDPALNDRAIRAGQPVERGGEVTDRPRRTDGGRNVPTTDGRWRRRVKDFKTEPVERTWNRKREEAADSGLISGWSNRLVRPISLSVDVTSPDGGKREVTGGHHRIVAAETIDPDMLLPVIHHSGGVEAARKIMRDHGGY